MKKKLRLPSHKSWQPLLRKAAAVAVVLGLGASGVAAWAANDGVIVPNGSGGGTGSGGSGSGTGGSVEVKWMVKDSWAASRDGVLQALSDMGYPENSGYEHDGNIATIDAAISDAVNECRATYTGNDDPQCRLVAVGIAGESGSHRWNHTSNWGDAKTWTDAWNAETSGRTYYHNGTPWNVDMNWTDKTGQRSVTKLAADVIRANLNAAIRLIVLAKNQPVNPQYDLRVSTKAAAPANMQVGDTSAVHDTITTSTDPSNAPAESVSADVILHYDLPQGSYVKAHAPVTKRVTLPSRGTTQSPDFTPADFGWTYWPEGSGWFDIRVSKQSKMKQAVDTADRDPAETFRVTATPPAPPVKTVEKGVSADSMTNRTRISTGTGVGGYELTIVDTINPNGVNYTVSNITVTDTTTGADITGECTTGWDRSANTVSAHRSSEHGLLPANHTVELAFDVTVSQPTDYKAVQDTGTVQWNHHPAVSTNPGEFPTWQPKPDKSWVRWDGKQWQTVIDPDHTNATGADRMVFLDGDKVGAVVNGTIPAHLAQAPERIVLTDNYANADYLWDPAEVKDMRVFEISADTDRHSSVDDIINKGRDVTGQWTVSIDTATHTITAASSKQYAQAQQNLPQPKQLTVLAPGVINFANGKGADQVRNDFGKNPSDELTFCADPARGNNPSDTTLTNAGAQTVNNHMVATNEPYICGYVPPVKKDVLAEASQGGDQESVDGKVVYPGQKVEYRLETQPQLPSNLGYTVESVVITDTFDEYLKPDKQTVELTDLTTGKIVSKKQYTTKWDDGKHQFVLTFGKDYVAKHWANGQNPRLLVRFEGTVSKDAPAKRTVDNQWQLTINNSVTVSNTVSNTPPDLNPHKADKSVKDASVSIDGKTLLVGERGVYEITLDARQQDTAYRVWRLGVTDDFDESHVQVNPQDITVMSDTGKDVTDQLNIQIRDGVAYIYAKTVDTEVPATGETVKGDPQPTDLAEYAALDRAYDPLHDPAIDQGLLGHSYTISLPYTVIAGGKGTVVENTALQITNDVKKQTETVANPVEEINPNKDVTVKVGGESADGKAVYLDSTFLYQLDSSVLPINRAYPEVSQWGIDDRLDPAYDQLTGQWAVYAARDLYKDGQVIAAAGDKIGGSNFDATRFGGDLFVSQLDPTTGKVVIAATDLYLKLVSADTSHEQAWRAYLQVKRVKTTERHENQFTEHVGDKHLTSNIVWTYTPDLTPSLHIEKYDVASGEQLGDRDDVKDALQMHGDSLEIAFKITNTSADTDGHGAWFKAADLKLDDRTIAGEGTVVDLTYPDNWDTLILKPGDSTVVTGTLKGVKQGGKHTDRVKVTGTPLVECPVTDAHPFDESDNDSDGEHGEGEGEGEGDVRRVTVGDRTLCTDTQVESNTDDWSGYRQKPLATTGSSTAGVIAVAVIALLSGAGVMAARSRKQRAVN